LFGIAVTKLITPGCAVPVCSMSPVVGALGKRIRNGVVAVFAPCQPYPVVPVVSVPAPSADAPAVPPVIVGGVPPDEKLAAVTVPGVLIFPLESMVAVAAGV
jgi:hypothetical protein